MLKKSILAAIVATCAAGSAQADVWNFEYQGFYNAQTGIFDADRIEKGYFKAFDLNNNNAIELDEVIELEVGRISYPDYNCDSSIGLYCDVSFFNYSANGKLSFAASRRYSDSDAGASSRYEFKAGDSIRSSYFHFDHMTGEYVDEIEEWRWTDQTKFTISPPPVPEPSTYLMLGIGGLLIGARQWRSRLQK